MPGGAALDLKKRPQRHRVTKELNAEHAKIAERKTNGSAAEPFSYVSLYLCGQEFLAVFAPVLLIY
jgi:hypothetical protein